jgi:hypothetical protein
LREKAVAEPDKNLCSDFEFCVTRRANHRPETVSWEAKDEILHEWSAIRK